MFQTLSRWLRVPAGPVLLAALVSIPGSVSAQSEGVDLVGHLELSADGAVTYNDVWGYSAPDGTELAILGSDVGTHFVDVTDPGAPYEVAFIPGGRSLWRDMKTYGHYAYSVNESGGGLQVIDLFDPLHPALVNIVEGAFSTAHNIFVDTGSATLWVVGATTTPQDNVFAYSLEPDPSTPAFITSWGGAYVHDIYVRDGLAYAAALYEHELWVLDVSQLPFIDLLAAVPTPGRFTHNTWLTEDGRYCLTTDENSGGHVGIFDVENPQVPVLVAEWTHPEAPASIVHNAFVKGDFAYVSWYSTGLQILDLRDPRTPARAGYYDTYPGTTPSYDGAWGVYPFARSGYTYISDISTGLYIVRFDGVFLEVAGVVRDDMTGEPLPGVVVSVAGSPETSTTDADGAYSVRLIAGSYELTYSGFGYFSSSLSVTVAESAVDGLDVELSRAPAGRVEGIVESVDGAPVEAVRIGIFEGVGERSSDAVLEARTDGFGRFVLPSVPSGDWIFRLESFGFPTEEHPVAIATGPNELRFVVFAARYRDDFEADETSWTVGGPNDTAISGVWERATPLVLEGNSAQPQEDHSVDGTQAFLTGAGEPGQFEGDHDVDQGITTLTSPVFDLGGLGQPGVSFHFWYANANGLSVDDEFVVEATGDGGASWIPIFRTGEGDESWRSAEILLGPEFVSSQAFQFRFIASDLGDPSLVEAAVDDIEVFDARGRLTGRVVSQEGGSPVPSATVTDQGSGVALSLDQDGRFEFVAPSGEIDLLVHAFGFVDQTVTMVIPNRRTLDGVVTLVPAPTRTVAGTVRATEGGTPLPGILVECVDTPLSTRTDDEGHWELAVPLGGYRLRFSSDDFVPVERDIEIAEAGGAVQVDVGLVANYTTSLDPIFPNPASGDSILRFRLPRAARVRVEVFDLAGRRVREIWDGEFGVGEHELPWDGRNDAGERVSVGIYFERFRGDGVEEVQRVIRVR